MKMIINSVMKKKRTSKGRQRIEMKKIEKRSNLQVTFSKRYKTLFNKAAQLGALTGVDVAVIVKSPGGKFFTFGSPSPDYVFDRFLSQNPNNPEAERNRERVVAVREKASGSEAFWWEEDVSTLGLAELENFKASLEELKNNLMTQANHVAINEGFTYGVSSSGVTEYDTFADVDFSDFAALEAFLLS